MSRSLALIKFLDTGNIYMGVYNGTVDVLYPYIFPKEKCWDPVSQGYCYLDYVDKNFEMLEAKTEPIVDSTQALDVEIYSDYGGGFFWDGKADENACKVLDEYLNPWGKNYPDPWTGDTSDCIFITDGKPEWVKEYMKDVYGGELVS